MLDHMSRVRALQVFCSVAAEGSKLSGVGGCVEKVDS